MAVLGIITATLGIMAGTTILRGIVLQALWGWFVAETFNIVELTLAQAIGLSLVVSFLTYQYDARNADENDRGAVESLVLALMVSLMLNGFAYISGAIVHSFM